MERKSRKKIHDYVIIGGGPSGLQLGYYMQQNKQDYIILEQGQTAGTFFKEFPKHGTLISINKVHTGYNNPEVNMRWDWNSLLTDDYSLLFKDYTSKYYPDSTILVKYLKDFTKKFKLNIKTEHEVIKISKDNSIFSIETNQATFYCNKLVVATGLSRPNIPNIKGIEYVTQYYDLNTNKTSLINKRVLIIGKGNSGFETANHLIDTASLVHILSPEPLKFAYNSRYPGHLRSINAEFMDTYLLKSQNGILNANIIEIKKQGKGLAVTIEYQNANDEIETVYYDEVISCTGFKFNSDIFDASCMPNLCINDKFPSMTSYFESTNIPELYFTGNITQSLDFKQKQSAFIHGFRYNAAFLAKYLLAIYSNKSLISETIANNCYLTVNHIITLINKNSAMWQQTGYLSCAYIFDNKNISFIENSPTNYLKKINYIKDKYCLIVSLDFGECIKEPGFNAITHNRIHKDNYEQAYDSSVIHPIITLLYDGKEIAKHHIIEDFENEWLEDVHIKPLEKFMLGVFDKIDSEKKINTTNNIKDYSQKTLE